MPFVRKQSYIFLLFSIGSIVLSCHANTNNSTNNKELAREYAALALERSRENKINDAIRLYKKAITLDPSCAENHFFLANHLFVQEKMDEAVQHYEIAASLQPSYAEIHCNLGICANNKNDHQSAITHFKNAIVADPACGIAHLQLALTLEKEKDFDTALIHFEKAMLLRPNDLDIPSHIGNALKKLERLEEAVAYYRKAYALKPHDINAMIDLANALTTIDENNEAIELYFKVLAIKPTLHTVLYNLGFTLKKMGLIKRAIEVHKKVLEYDPTYAPAHFSLGISYLTLGQFEMGWPEYEWRWAAYKEKPREFPHPTWDGSDLKGKKIYVYAEQGYGDTFQFIRYLQLLKNMGAHVIFYSQMALKSLLTLCPYIDEVITYGDSQPDFDYHIPLMSLPLLFNTALATVPTQIPYLYAREDLVKKWKKKLSHNTFKIGICWQGNDKYPTASLRRTVAAKSLHVKYFKALANVPGITLYSLQKMNGTEQINELEDSSFIHVFGPDLDTTNGRFNDTAAIIKNLDLVISADTSIGHFAAALGTPTWIVLPEPADWRWMLNRLDTPWYPNVRLFRQPKPGDWDSVMENVVRALEARLHGTPLDTMPYTQNNNDTDTVASHLANCITTLESIIRKTDKSNTLATAYALQGDIVHYLQKSKGH